MEDENWCTTPYKWGEIGKVRQIKKSYWPFGCFRKIESLAKTEDFELKYWEIEKPKNNEKSPHEPKFQVLATEYNFIIKGRIKGRIRTAEEDIQTDLSEGDYIVIKPGAIVNLQEEIISEDVEGITIKVPSRHGDTIKKSFIEKLLNKI